MTKVGKTTRPSRSDLHQIPYDYTVGMRNRFKRLNLIDRVHDELWTEEPGRLQSMGSHRVGHDRCDLAAAANYVGGNDNNDDLLQKIPCMYCYTHCLQPCSRLSPTHASALDSWILLSKSESVFCGVTAPFSWVLVHTRFCLCPPRICFPSPA